MASACRQRPQPGNAADGIRCQYAVNGTTTNYVLDASMFVREQRVVNGAPVNLATYLVGPRGPEYRRDYTTGAIRWYVYDGLGCVAAEVDPSGTVTAKRKYDVYGLVRSGDAGTSAHKFVGQLGHPSEAESGLVYMRARHMDPAIGRFISLDPGRHRSNWFAYCSNNSVNRVDGNGRLDGWLDIFVNGLMVFLAGAAVFLAALALAVAVVMMVAATAEIVASIACVTAAMVTGAAVVLGIFAGLFALASFAAMVVGVVLMINAVAKAPIGQAMAGMVTAIVAHDVQIAEALQDD